MRDLLMLAFDLDQSFAKCDYSDIKKPATPVFFDVFVNV